MRIGIISLNLHVKCINYGSFLQSYALHRFLEKNGYENDVIDYLPAFKEGLNTKYPHKTVKVTGLSSLAVKTLFWLNKRVGADKYDKFISFAKKHMSISKEKYAYNNFDTDKYDLYITGSDVIWDLSESKRTFEKGFYGDFPCIRNVISYAPSFGSCIYSEAEAKRFQKLLKKYRAISTREATNEPAFGDLKEGVTTVLDPTFLLDKSDYEELLVPPQIDNKYLLYYVLETNLKANKIVDRFAKEKGLKVVEISRNVLDAINHDMRYGAGIEEWIGLIKNAEYIVANSFHGTIFSIIFKRPFFAYSRKGAESKITWLCNSLGLQDRLTTLEMPLVDSPIDWNSVYSELERRKTISKDFLLNAVKDVENII